MRVRSGRDKGREGTIEAIFGGNRALVQGINVYKKHVKKTMTRDSKGGIFDIPRPIEFSKLAVVDPKTGKATRVGFRLEGTTKVRVSKKSGQILDKVK